MAFDPGLAERLETLVATRSSNISGLVETRMFGGFGYLLNGNMCVGIHNDTLIIRVGEETATEIIANDHVRPMDLTGKVMKAWATIECGALDEDEDLAHYLELAIKFVSSLPPKSKD